MSFLRFRLLGDFKFARSDGDWRTLDGRSERSLLAYLLIFRHKLHLRGHLAGLLWSEFPEERARGSLRTALWRLRRKLGLEPADQGGLLVSTPAGDLGINSDASYELDIAVFEKSLGRIGAERHGALSPADLAQLKDALDLYNGHLLEGYIDEWLLSERERLRALYVEGAIHLMKSYRALGRNEEALAVGRDLLAREPLRETLHRDVMRLFLACGRRAEAVQQYRDCAALLMEELGVPPMEATQRLYHEIQDRPRNRAAAVSEPDAKRLLADFRKSVAEVMDLGTRLTGVLDQAGPLGPRGE